MNNSQDEFKELQTLLRLKKYEQPPAGYADRFLKEFHRRQRWEASQPKGFAAVWEAFNEWIASHTVPKYAYAGTFGLFLMAVLAINGLTGKPGTENVASAPAISAPVNLTPASLALNRPLDLSVLEVQSQMSSSLISNSSESRPRYILDARPASYEAPFSF